MCSFKLTGKRKWLTSLMFVYSIASIAKQKTIKGTYIEINDLKKNAQ